MVGPVYVPPPPAYVQSATPTAAASRSQGLTVQAYGNATFSGYYQSEDSAKYWAPLWSTIVARVFVPLRRARAQSPPTVWKPP